jgi:hypothetical protein
VRPKRSTGTEEYRIPFNPINSFSSTHLITAPVSRGTFKVHIVDVQSTGTTDGQMAVAVI